MIVPGIPFVEGLNDYVDRDGKKYGIAMHNTSNNASDEGEAEYATWRPDGIGAHFYVDIDSVTQSIDTDKRTGHAGSYEGNEHAIAIEITGANSKSRAWWLANVAWVKLAQVIVYVLKHDPDYAGFEIRRATVAEMRANPKVKAFYGHNDMRLAWGGTTHSDPGDNFPWDHFLATVRAAYDDTPEEIDMDANQIAELSAIGGRVYALFADKDNAYWKDLRKTNPDVVEPNIAKQKRVALEQKLATMEQQLALVESDLDTLIGGASLDPLEAVLRERLTDAQLQELGIRLSSTNS